LIIAAAAAMRRVDYDISFMMLRATLIFSASLLFITLMSRRRLLPPHAPAARRAIIMRACSYFSIFLFVIFRYYFLPLFFHITLFR